MARENTYDQEQQEFNFQDDYNESPADRLDMERFGSPHRMLRSLNATTVAFFMIIAMSSWAYILNGASLGLLAAGTGGTIAVYIGAAICYSSIVVSMAELASMVPLSGGPYHWISVLSSERYVPGPRILSTRELTGSAYSWRKLLSYVAGWLLTLSWMFGIAAGLFISATLIRLTATLGDPDDVPQAWQTYLILLALLAVCTVLNTICVRFLPVLEWLAGIIFVCGFVTTVVVYAVMAPKASASEVFGTFTNGGGWSNLGFAILTSQVFALYCLFASDGAAHMAEETRDASLSVPRGMVASFLFSAITGLGMLILFCFCFTEEAMAATEIYGYAFIGVNVVATRSPAGAKGMTSIVIILTLLSTNNFLAASSRQLMAFARDGGVPFGAWVAQVPPGLKYPLNAVLVVAVFSALLALITLGSTVAFQAIVSLVLMAFIATYELSICVLIWRRLSGLPLPPARWSLERLGLPVNIFAALYGLFALAFIVIPASPTYDAATFNWAPVIFVGLMTLALLFYLVGGKDAFEGPAVKWTDSNESDKK